MCTKLPSGLVPSPDAHNVPTATHLYIPVQANSPPPSWVSIRSQIGSPMGFYLMSLTTTFYLNSSRAEIRGYRVHASGAPMHISKQVDASLFVSVTSEAVVIQPPSPLEYAAAYTIETDLLSGQCSSWTFKTKEISPTEPTHWTVQCDPWKERAITLSDYTTLGNWQVCPAKYRSLSGCNDFKDDTRAEVCENEVLLAECHVRQMYQRSILSLPMNEADFSPHECFNIPISYDHINKYNWVPGKGYPPTNSKHRDQWGKWGQYEYIPPERWQHNTEHGGVAFLYNNCLGSTSICALRSFVSNIIGQDDGGAFRWVMSPYGRFQGGLALAAVVYGHVYASPCLNQKELAKFVEQHYRQAIEDIFLGGFYTHLESTSVRCSSEGGSLKMSPSAVFFDAALVSSLGLIFVPRRSQLVLV